jgi:hypothetical protein
VTLGNVKVTSNGQVGSPSQHSTEARKVRSFSVLFAAALVAKSGVFFFFFFFHSLHEFGTKFLSIFWGIASNRLQIWVAGAAIYSRLHECAKNK